MIAMKLFSAAVLFIIGDVLAVDEDFNKDPVNVGTVTMAPVSVKLISKTEDLTAACPIATGDWSTYTDRFDATQTTNACGSKEKPCLANVTNSRKTFCLEGCVFKAMVTYRERAEQTDTYPIYFKVYKEVKSTAVLDLPDACYPEYPEKDHKYEIAVEIEHGGFVEMCDKVCVVSLATVPDAGDKNVGTYCIETAVACTADGLGIEGTTVYTYDPITDTPSSRDLSACYDSSAPGANCPAAIKGYLGKAIFPATITSENPCGGYSKSVAFTKESRSDLCPAIEPVPPMIDNCGYLSKPIKQPCYTNIVEPEADEDATETTDVCKSCVQLAFVFYNCKEESDLTCTLYAGFHALVFDELQQGDGDWFSYQPGATAMNRALQFNCPNVCDKTDENENDGQRPWYCAKNEKKECDETVADKKCCDDGYKHIQADHGDNTPLLKFTTDKGLNLPGAELRIVKVADVCEKKKDAADVSYSRVLVPALVMMIVSSLF